LREKRLKRSFAAKVKAVFCCKSFAAKSLDREKMTTTDKLVDPEIDQIKAKLQMLGIVILVAAVILPFGLPFWLSMPAIGIGTVGGWYAVLKLREARQNAVAKS
jgi:hypothetical protein